MEISNYVLRFGKYKDHRAVDVAEIYKVNPKTGQDEPVGLKYLKFLCDQDWFRHKDIIEHIIKKAEECMSEIEEEPKEEPKKKEPKTKKEQNPKKTIVKVSNDGNTVVDFQ